MRVLMPRRLSRLKPEFGGLNVAQRSLALGTFQGSEPPLAFVRDPADGERVAGLVTEMVACLEIVAGAEWTMVVFVSALVIQSRLAFSFLV